MFVECKLILSARACKLDIIPIMYNKSNILLTFVPLKLGLCEVKKMESLSHLSKILFETITYFVEATHSSSLTKKYLVMMDGLSNFLEAKITLKKITF